MITRINYLLLICLLAIQTNSFAQLEKIRLSSCFSVKYEYSDSFYLKPKYLNPDVKTINKLINPPTMSEFGSIISGFHSITRKDDFNKLVVGGSFNRNKILDFEKIDTKSSYVQVESFFSFNYEYLKGKETTLYILRYHLIINNQKIPNHFYLPIRTRFKNESDKFIRVIDLRNDETIKELLKVLGSIDRSFFDMLIGLKKPKKRKERKYYDKFTGATNNPILTKIYQHYIDKKRFRKKYFTGKLGSEKIRY